LADYIERRGERIWQHRTLSAGYITGTLPYEVFKRAQFHCELCGISAIERALEADHIVRETTGDQTISPICKPCAIAVTR